MNLSSLRSHIITELKSVYNRREAENISYILMEDKLKVPKGDFILRKDENIKDEDLKKINAIINRLKNNEPLQYILGYSQFYDMELKVDSHVLIPRPETEELVDVLIKSCELKTPKVLDIGTGSGCIALAVKKEIPNAIVHGVDVSASSVEFARYNAELNNLNVKFEKLDILNESPEEKYDIIVSNPPYVAESEYDDLGENVRDYEPYIALFTGKDNPLIFYKEILNKAYTILKPNGIIFFELNENHTTELSGIFEEMGFKYEIIQDLSGKNRFGKLVLNSTTIQQHPPPS